MKLFIFALASFASVSALACSPAPYPYMYQQAELSYMLSSPKVSMELARLGGSRINSIETTDGFYHIKLSPNCFVKAKVIYSAPTNPGLCPRMTDISIVDSGCL